VKLACSRQTTARDANNGEDEEVIGEEKENPLQPIFSNKTLNIKQRW
jgi:hypothetical protein